MTTKLSILIPHFNDPEGFALTLGTITAQTWKGDREIIVCDDGSRPENVAALEQVVAQSSERIRLLRNPGNKGRPYTRNVLLDAAEGKYLTWCDSGDEYYPNKLEAQFEGLYAARLAGPDGPVWCTCNSHWLWEGARRKKVVAQAVVGDQISNLFLGTLRAYLYTLLGTTESFRAVGYFDLKLPRLQDLDFFLRFTTKGGRLVLPVTPEPLCLYHKSDVGRKGHEVLAASKHIFDKHAPLLMQRSRRFRRNRMFQLYQHAARYTSNNNDHRRTALYVGASALYNPFAFTKWLVKHKGKL